MEGSGSVFSRDVRFCRGVGEKRAAALRKLGVTNLSDLITFYPRTYIDKLKIAKISELEPGRAQQFTATVITQPHTALLRGSLTITKLRAADETGAVNIVFFNQRYAADRLEKGGTYLFYGKVTDDGYGLTVSSPTFVPSEPDDELSGTIEPVYRLSAGLTQKSVAQAVSAALEAVKGELKDTMPESVIQGNRLARYGFAIENIHKPLSFETLELARRRLVFEELFYISLGLLMLKSRRSAVPGAVFENTDVGPFISALPFKLTGAQLRVIGRTAEDLGSGRLMNRLVQGDVGSGKTMVAAAAAYLAAKNGRQALLMAPTEILASQHYATLSPLFEKLGYKTVLITGKMPASEAKKARAAAKSGEASLIIGTHALISGKTEYSDPALVICDEQHRFGVEQRAALTAKGVNPHMLVMSATPIPRTLALILYGDLDVSQIDELPPGRSPVDTFMVDESYRARLEKFVRKQVQDGHSVYIVCPLIDEDDSGEVKSVTEYADSLAKSYSDLRVGVLHGKMKPAEKEEIMRSFASGQTDVLVSTTVVEVGVDNPNASLMVVENADRFGLSQLHQLRGRVGRGSVKSYCVLINAGGTAAAERLKAVCELHDGFKIAEKDLELRGPGSFFGSEQSGLPGLKLACLSTDTEAVAAARTSAEALLKRDAKLELAEDEPAAKRVKELFNTEDGNIFN